MSRQKSITQDETKAWVNKIDHWQQKLSVEFPEIDPHDMRMMLRSIFQPQNVPRRWLLRKEEDGKYVL